MKVGMLLAPTEQALYSGVSLPPHTLGIMTAGLRARGHQVRQFDLDTDLIRFVEDGRLSRADLMFLFDKETVLGYVQGAPDDHVDRVIETFLKDKAIAEVDVVGLSIGGSFHWFPIHLGLLIGKYIRTRLGIPVIIGGNNVFYLTLFQEVYAELWEVMTGAFPFIIVGSGHEAMHDLLDRLQVDRGYVPCGGDIMPGLVSRGSSPGSITCRPQAPSRVIRPDFHGLDLQPYLNILKDPAQARDPALAHRQNIEQMFKWPTHLNQLANQVNRRRRPRGHVGKLTIPYVFNYHCPYACAFCAESDPQSTLVVGDPHRVVDDLEYLTQEYDTEYVYFYNNYFNLSRHFVEEFCAEVARRGITMYWQDCARFNLFDPQLAVALHESGCRALWFGMETGGDKLRRRLDKKLSLEQIERGLQICQDVGIWANLEMIVGFPHEDPGDFDETTAFLLDHAEQINFFQSNQYFVVPNSTIGLHPERFDITIVPAVNTYESLLAANREWFAGGKGMGFKPNNFDIHGFDEIDGRSHVEVRAEGARRLGSIRRLQRREFTEINQMLRLLDAAGKARARDAREAGAVLVDNAAGVQ